MPNDVTGRFYVHDRVLVAGLGLALGTLAMLQWLRNFDTAEVVATLSMFAVFVGVAGFDVAGGLVVGLVATVVYALLRLPEADIVGSADVFRSVVLRGLVFVGFGTLGGYAHRIVKHSIHAQKANEIVDTRTSCLSGRALVDILDSEIARSARYHREFSVITIDLGEDVVGGLGTKQLAAVLRELGELLRSSIRTTDRVATVSMPDRERIVLVLPETPLSGAEIFLPRVADRVSALLLNRKAAMPRKIGDAFSSIHDLSHIRRLRNETARVAEVPMILEMGSR
jgi:GGDEF domain-containing protein